VFNRDEIRRKTITDLRTTLAHQQRGRLRYRHEPTVVHRLLDVLKEDGMELGAMRGPWSISAVQLRRRGRGAPVIPCVERGQTRLFAASEERARELAGLLNWCEIEEVELQSEGPPGRR
jgi:hypothetical protein